MPISRRNLSGSQKINISIVIVVSSMLFLSACANQNGTYEPSCIAYEGDTIEINDNRFEWQKFTDQRNIDAQGNLVDAFPDYPKFGTVIVTGERVEFRADDSTFIDDYFLVEHRGSRYLLSQDQHQLFSVEGKLATCALQLNSDD